MQLKTLLLVVATGAAAQSPTRITPSLTSSAPASTSTSLPGLVAQLPQCALSCFSTAAQGIGCAPSDFACLCSNSASLVAKLGPCIVLSSCSTDDISSKFDPFLQTPPAQIGMAEEGRDWLVLFGLLNRPCSRE